MGITLVPAALRRRFLCSPGWKASPTNPVRAVFGAALLRHTPRTGAGLALGTRWSSWS